MSAIAAPAPTALSVPKRPEVVKGDLLYVQLAREIAMDIYPLERILVNHKVYAAQWEEIKDNPRFQNYLRTKVEEWSSSMNTAERVKVKSLAFIEEVLPEFFARAHDPNEGLSGKVKMIETIGGFAELGKKGGFATATGEKFSVTINMGSDPGKPEQIIVSAPTQVPDLKD
jgi:hypothetical protein